MGRGWLDAPQLYPTDIDRHISNRYSHVMNLIVSPAAQKALGKMPKADAAALIVELKAFAAAPFAQHSFAKGLVGGGTRVRHGDWRAVCQINGKALSVVVVKVGNRREVYR